MLCQWHTLPTAGRGIPNEGLNLSAADAKLKLNRPCSCLSTATDTEPSTTNDLLFSK